MMDARKEGRTVKALLTGAMLCAAACALMGCAPQPLTKAEVDGKVVCNADYMSQVEQKARREGMHIQWVNCPQAVLRAG
jgi:hypothetical protein